MRHIITQPIPVFLLTGFLGAGKTTLLNRLLSDPSLEHTGVVINEFGDVPLDGTLIRSATGGGAVLEMSGGCLCCAGGGALEETLGELIETAAERGKPLERIVIETSGMADPLPILGEIGTSEFVRLHGVLTVIDAVHGAATLGEFAEAKRQVAIADMLLLSKGDLTSDEQRREVISLAREIAPDIAVLPVDAPAWRILAPTARNLMEAGETCADPRCAGDCGHGHDHAGGHENGHRHGYATTVLRCDRPIAPRAMQGFLEVLTGTLGGRLLRVKGLAHIAGEMRPVVVQAVQGTVHPPSFLEGWPDGDRPQTALVVITQGHREGEIEGIFGAFTGQAGIDRPDAAALQDNPLALPGFTSM